jgi:hypothetical protein
MSAFMKGNDSMKRSIKSATEAVGGLSKPSKMPCYGYSTPAASCSLGSLLRRVKGSTCEGCYAMKGCYSWPTVKNALERREAILRACEHDAEDRREWVDNMSYLLNVRAAKWRPGDKYDHRFFRWHDSGDLLGAWHLTMIVDVALATRDVEHWLPTREVAMINTYYRVFTEFPSNLNVRISAPMVNGPAPKVKGCTQSTVHTHEGIIDGRIDGVICGAPSNNGECGDCRACWAPWIESVSYAKH